VWKGGGEEWGGGVEAAEVECRGGRKCEVGIIVFWTSWLGEVWVDEIPIEAIYAAPVLT
jgi:hypothetical protein